LLLALAATVLAAACQYGSNTDTSTSASWGSTSTPTSPTLPTSPTSPTTPPTPTTPTDPGTPTTPAPAPAGLTYATDIAPIMNADCVRCHGPVVHDAGYNLSTYSGVMKAVTAGSANSILVRVTQSSGIMYVELSGNRAQKAQTLHDWVVTWKAHQ
jgi:hypothetical protein